MGQRTAIEVDRSDLHTVQVRTEEDAPLAEGDARIAVESFALTSNNITYAVFGDAMQYWDFFPVPAPSPGDGDAPAWGRVPVWGFGRVVESRSGDVEVGRRLYGYWPMATELIVTPGRADERGFTDVAPHRAEMASAYSRYVYVDADPIYREDREAHQMLLYPLFFTSFVIDDFLEDNGDFGAEQIWMTSASSKTSIGVAFLAKQRGAGVLVGLTSERNRAFVEQLDLYDRVLTYGEVADVEPSPAVYIDMAGNGDVTRDVHRHLGAELAYSMVVGGTHWDHQDEAEGPDAELVGPRPEFFFAPTQISKRTKDWGRATLDAKVGAAWDAFTGWVDGWLQLHDAEGPHQVEAAYRELLENRSDPRAGYVCTLRD